MNDKGERDTIREEKTPQRERKNADHQEKEVQFIEPFKRPKTSSRSESNTGRAVEITPQSNPDALGNISAGSVRSGVREEAGREKRREGERELTRDHMGRPVFGADDIPKDPTGSEYVRQGTLADDFAAAEAKRKPQVIAATVVALLAVVAILCTMIWRISHREDGNMLVDNDQVAETLIGNTGQLLLAEGDVNAASDVNASDSGASGASVVDEGADGNNALGSNVTGGTGSAASSTAASGTTASGTTASGTTASGATASSNTPSGTDVSGTTASRPSGTNASSQAGEVAVSGQASAGWPSGSGTDQAGMDHSGESGLSGETAISMTFEDLEDTVTAKVKTNLRSAPSTASDDLVVTQIINGDQVERIGINYDTGWSKLEVDGQILYAVSGYLTNELEPKTAEVMATPTQKLQTDRNRVVTVSGRTIQFTDCDDTVSAKIRCNLRGEPSTDQGNASIHRELVYGDQVHRTGISEEFGWSRIEVDGEVLYAVSSYLYTIDDTSAETTE
jgi:hypothetical protein